MSDIRKLLDAINEMATTSGSVASVASPMGGVKSRKKDSIFYEGSKCTSCGCEPCKCETSEGNSVDGTKTPDAPAVSEFGLWKNSALIGQEQRDKKKKKPVKESKKSVPYEGDRAYNTLDSEDERVARMAHRQKDERLQIDELGNSLMPGGQRKLRLAQETFVDPRASRQHPGAVDVAEQFSSNPGMNYLMYQQFQQLGQAVAQLSPEDLSVLASMGRGAVGGAVVGGAAVSLGFKFLDAMRDTMELVKKKSKADTSEIFALQKQIVSINKMLSRVKSDAAKEKYQNMLKQAYEVLDELKARHDNGVAEGILGDIGDEIKHGVRGLKRKMAGKPSRRDVKDKYIDRGVAARAAGDDTEAKKNFSRWEKVHNKTNSGMLEEQGVDEGWFSKSKVKSPFDDVKTHQLMMQDHKKNPGMDAYSWQIGWILADGNDDVKQAFSHAYHDRVGPWPPEERSFTLGFNAHKKQGVAEDYDSGDAYDKWDPKHPHFVKNYKKFQAKNPGASLADFIAHMKKGVAEGEGFADMWKRTTPKKKQSAPTPGSFADMEKKEKEYQSGQKKRKEQGVAEGSEEGSYSDKFVQSQIDYYTKHGLSGTAADRERINGSLNYYQHIKNKRIKDGTWQEQGVAEAANVAQQAAIAVNMKKHHDKPEVEEGLVDPWHDKYFGRGEPIKKIFQIKTDDKSYKVKAETEQQAREHLEKHAPGSHIVSVKFLKNIMPESSVEEGLGKTLKQVGKSVKRGLQGWSNDNREHPSGFKPPTKPHEIVKHIKNTSDEQLSSYRKMPTDPENGPMSLRHKVVDREMKKRGMKEQSVEEGLGKTLKKIGKNIGRASVGWGDEMFGKPQDVVHRNKGYDTDTLKRLQASPDECSASKPGHTSPRALQTKVVDRELKRRGAK